MKVMTPHYYKDFRCIAGACTDTCCAGWDVDVDKNSYKYYKTVKGAFGKRLKSVMVPSQDGECTFTLKEGGRCPFLNDDNLCDLYIELGEDKLCETCAEFPRFINDYGNIREIGIAPSCKTAGELMFSYKDELTFDTVEDNSLTLEPNDIDAYTYMHLRQARIVAFGIISDRDISIFERLTDDSGLAAVMKTYHAGSEAFAHEYEQLAMYYVYRYMLDAVNDYDILLKAKNAVIGILAVDIMAAANQASGCMPDFTMRVDIAHLYSRQFEHSYYNYEIYREYFGMKRCYSYKFLMDALVSLN